jgi:hypothetical protein
MNSVNTTSRLIRYELEGFEQLTPMYQISTCENGKREGNLTSRQPSCCLACRVRKYEAEY